MDEINSIETTMWCMFVCVCANTHMSVHIIIGAEGVVQGRTLLWHNQSSGF